MRYHKNWFSYVLFGFLALFDLILTAVAIANEITFPLMVLLCAVSIGMILFTTLKVSVDKEMIRVSYLLGLVTNYYYLGDLELVQAVDNRHFISWIFNPAGKYCALIRTRSGITMHLPVENELKLIPICRS